jgi:hypothetical protein
MKAVTLVSAIVFIAITVSAMALIYQTGIPILQRMQSSAGLDRMTSAFTELDEKIQMVASEGNGSRRVFDLDTGEGRLSVDPSGDEISWVLEAEQSVLRPRTARHLGNVVSGSNLETSLYEGVHGANQAYIMENAHLRVYLRRIQPEQAYSTGELLLDVFQKDLGEWLPMDYLNISIDGDSGSKSGLGRTEAARVGTSLPRAEVIAYMNSSYADYWIRFTLESGADFILVEGDLQ